MIYPSSRLLCDLLHHVVRSQEQDGDMIWTKGLLNMLKPVLMTWKFKASIMKESHCLTDMNLSVSVSKLQVYKKNIIKWDEVQYVYFRPFYYFISLYCQHSVSNLYLFSRLEMLLVLSDFNHCGIKCTMNSSFCTRNWSFSENHYIEKHITGEKKTL